MRKAFTLVELLVVITIIAILAAVAFPVLARASRRARSTECMSNLHQIGGAITAYADDWDQRYPWCYCEDSVYLYHSSPSIVDLVGPYVRVANAWHCPEDVGEVDNTTTLWRERAGKPFYSMVHTSYSWRGIGGGGIAGKPMASIKSPAQAVLSNEGRPWHGVYSPYEQGILSSALYNVLHCDGHVNREIYSAWWSQRY